MRVEITTTHGAAVAELQRPRGALHALAVLTHGANGNPDTADLLAVGAALLGAGVAVARATQPYRVAGRGSPPPAPKQDEAWLELIAALRRRRGLRSLPLIVGGRSNGARVAARTAQAAGASAVLALAFPVHPPGKPELTRLPELDAAGVPTLVVQGGRDPFGMPPPAQGRTIVIIAAGDHSLRRDPGAVAAAALGFVLRNVPSATVPARSPSP